MTPGICQLCGETKDLSYSHIFPEFFYESNYDEDHRFVSVTSHPMHKPRSMQKGFREHLLCAECETQFSKYESYAATLLRRADAAPILNGGITLTDVDFKTFRLFGLSLLWRLHLSRTHTFRAVDLGPHAEGIRTMLQREDPGEPHEYGFALIKATGLDTEGEIMIGPAPGRYHGVRVYHFMARGYRWVFLVSRKPLALQDQLPSIGTNGRLFIPAVEHDKQTIYRQLRRAFPKWLGTKSTD
jgi:hypothetical protein